ncbi:MAG TPA: hypothetical protein DEB06_04120 [Phycisphaerales bacterium]|nr:hypothetical protein [Phycisphaerales bacterium]
MLAVIALGLWLVWGPGERAGTPEPRPGARLLDLRIGYQRGVLEVVPDSASGHTFRFLFRDGSASPVLSEGAVRAVLPAEAVDRVLRTETNWVFRVLNITSWGSLLWVGIGLAAQAAFSARFLIQWIVSEKERRSVIPELFWWISLVGGVGLFAYFAWRQDIVGVLGQSSGLVIYARNLRLIHKQRRRDRRRSAAQATGG